MKLHYWQRIWCKKVTFLRYWKMKTNEKNFLKLYHQHFTQELDRIQMSFDNVTNKHSKSKYRVKYFCIFVFLTLAPFLAYYSGYFGIYLSDNLFSMASTGDSAPFQPALPQNVLWYYASAGLGVLVICIWLTDELLGTVSRKRW